MEEKKFDENVEMVYDSLSYEEKAEYLSKENKYWDRSRSASIAIIIFFAIGTVMMVSSFVTTKDTGYLTGIVILAIFVMIGLVSFYESVVHLKLSNDTKVKNCIQRLKNQEMGVKTVPDRSTRRYLSPIEKIDRMSGEEFEMFMEGYFRRLGYVVRRTPLSGDYGVDLIIYHAHGKTGVQLKRYSDKVSSQAVAQVKLGLAHYGLNDGMVITNNYFQQTALTLAAENNITLWDRDRLIFELSKTDNIK